MAKLVDCTVVRDTREKPGQGWFFKTDERKSGKIFIRDTIVDTLETGDYSLLEHPKLVVLERKASLSELAMNMIGEGKPRFEREMERMREYRYKYILIETVPSKDTLSLGVPQVKYPFPMSRVTQWLFSLEMTFGVNFKFVGDCGIKLATQIFTEALLNG